MLTLFNVTWNFPKLHYGITGYTTPLLHFSVQFMMDNEGSDICSSNEGDSYEDEQVQIVHSLPYFLLELIAAGASSSLAKTTVAPLERIKILLQVKYVNSLLVTLFFFFNEPFFQDYNCYIL